MSMLDWGPISRIRRNHALEHATLQILAARSSAYRMAGYSDTRGFWMFGNVATEEISSAVEEALQRLQGGEHQLAVHPNCGTNFATAGLLVGSLAWLAMLGSEGGWKKRIERLPMLVSLATLALILAQPLGPLLQAHVTTDGVPRGLRVVRITKDARGASPVHRILTEA